ncbi:MAG: sulfatase-like hydrolase/transferase [Balneolaceae bacterium]|nr:sulfatase-like hydrolase/transferase [Balneolaceae bacterium]
MWISAEDIGPALGAYGDQFANTPNLDRLAEQGILYRNAYVPAPICAPARSSIITGIHATTLGTQHLRSEIPIPEEIQTLPEYLKNAGYFTTNNSKTDYNFDPTGRWDENGGEAHWRNRPNDTPFFSVFNYGISHEGQANKSNPETDSLLANFEQRQDPQELTLPPYLPETPEMRRIWARYYDLITLLDNKVGDLLGQLEADGLMEDTIIVFWSDHGYGLPRYKRWPYRSGLHVPLIVRVPEKFRHLVEFDPGTETDRLVNLVDLAPTMLSLAGAEIPETMQGRAFLGDFKTEPRDHMVATRSRADDIYEVSRTVIDERYLYVRNYLPHQPWTQDAIIFGEGKASYRELLRVRREGELPEAAREMFEPKPTEELYDLQEDPWELNNLAGSEEHRDKLKQMRVRLEDWIMETRDTGFLAEAEMMIRSEGSTPYEMAQDPARYRLADIKAMAEKVGDPDVPERQFLGGLGAEDSGVRYWSVMGLLARADLGKEVSGQGVASLQSALRDDSPAVRIRAAEALCLLEECSDQALSVLSENLLDHDRPTVSLQAAISIRRIGDRAKPIVPALQQVQEKYTGDKGPGRGYSSWSYPMFIGFAVDQALENCGIPWRD